MAGMTNDLTAVRQMYGPALMQGAFTAMTFVFALLSMLSVSVKLTVIAMILMPLASVAFWWVGRNVHVRFERLQAKFGDLSTKAQENFSGIRVVKAFSQEKPEVRDFARVNRDYVGKAIDRKSTRLNSSHLGISYAVFCLKKKKLILTSVTPASSAPVLQTPKATSSTLYFDSLTVNAGNGGFLHCIQMDTSVNAANQVVSVGADIAFFFYCNCYP